jgi:putative tricarboxylic transport membrane protein
VLALLGIAGYVLRTLGYEPAPLVLALVIGPMMETALRESLIIFRGDVSRMVFRPIAGTIYLVALAALVTPVLVRLLRRRSA